LYKKVSEIHNLKKASIKLLITEIEIYKVSK